MYSLLTAVAFAMTSQAAFAACDLVSDGRGTISNDLFEAKNAPTDSSAMANLLYGQLASRGPVLKQQCTAEQYIAAFIRLNPSYAPDKPMLIPVLNATSVSAPAAAAPAPKPAVSPAEVTQVREEQARVREEQAKVQTEKANLERAINTLKKLNEISAEQADSIKVARAEIAKLAAEDVQLEARWVALETRLTTLEGEVSSLKTTMVGKADKTYVDTALKGKADADKVYNKEEVDKMFEELPAGESLPWWAKLLIAVSAIGAILGAWAFYRKTPTPAAIDTSKFASAKELEAVKAEVADVREQGGFALITLENDWYAQIMQLTEGQERVLKVLTDGKLSHTILVERSSGDAAFIKAGIAGHVGTNLVAIGNLQTIVRKATNPKNFRLNNPIGLSAVA